MAMSKPPEKTILSVDNNAERRAAMSHILRQAGFRVLEAATAGAALQQVMAPSSPLRLPQLILLDSGLPDLHSAEVCQKLKNNPATQALPVLLLSGTQTKSEERVRGLESGVDAYLCQSAEPAELLAMINALLRKGRVEGHFRNMIDELEAVIWEADATTGDFTFVSQQAEQMLGYPPERWLRQPDFLRHLLHPADREAVLQKRREATTAGRPYELEYRAVAAGQHVHWVRDLVRVVKNGSGRPHLLRGMMVDITGRKQAEEEQALLLARQQAACQRAEESSRLKDEFLSLVSHELRAPLNSIQGWVRLLREGRLDAAEMARALETIDNSARAQNKIINDLLDISRILTGRLLLNLRPVAPAQVIEATLEAVQPLAETKNITLVAELEGTDGMIYADADRLQQVCWNLLSNAIKFTPQGGHVSVGLQRRADSLEIRVTDSGLGIAPDFLPFVFDHFRQQDSAITRRYSGLGLSLALVRHLVEMHNGTVRAENGNEGTGASFSVTLPLVSEAQALKRTLFEPDMDELDEPPELEGLRVLVVDDDADARGQVETILTQCGGRVVTAASAHEGLKIMAQPLAQRPEILISDIEMPEMNGYQLVRQLRTRAVTEGGAVPAIALSTQDQVENRLPALAAGFQMHVAKPVDKYELVTVVASLTGRLTRKVVSH
jgi:PAS domain S-box-containing protein